MMGGQRESEQVAGGTPLQHLQVAVRIAGGKYGAFADLTCDGDSFIGLIIYEENMESILNSGLPLTIP